MKRIELEGAPWWDLHSRNSRQREAETVGFALVSQYLKGVRLVQRPEALHVVEAAFHTHDTAE